MVSCIGDRAYCGFTPVSKCVDSPGRHSCALQRGKGGGGSAARHQVGPLLNGLVGYLSFILSVCYLLSHSKC